MCFHFGRFILINDVFFFHYGTDLFMVVLISFSNPQLQTIPNVQQSGLFRREKTFKHKSHCLDNDNLRQVRIISRDGMASVSTKRNKN